MSFTPVANLPPVSTTLAKMMEKFAASVVDTGGNFAAGVLDTPLSLMPVVHLDLRISLLIFEQNWNGLNGILLGLGGNWFMKKTRSKTSRDTVPLNLRLTYSFMAGWTWEGSRHKHRIDRSSEVENPFGQILQIMCVLPATEFVSYFGLYLWAILACFRPNLGSCHKVNIS